MKRQQRRPLVTCEFYAEPPADCLCRSCAPAFNTALSLDLEVAWMRQTDAQSDADMGLGPSLADLLSRVIPGRVARRATATAVLGAVEGLGCAVGVEHGSLSVRPLACLSPDLSRLCADLTPEIEDLIDERAAAVPELPAIQGEPSAGAVLGLLLHAGREGSVSQYEQVRSPRDREREHGRGSPAAADDRPAWVA